MRGNGWTRPDRVDELALLRSADLTLQAGYRYFIIAEKQAGEQTVAFTMPQQTYTTGTVTANPYSNTAYWNATSTSTGGQTMLVSKPRVTYTVLCGNVKPSGMSYDAQRVCQSLGAKFGGTCGKAP